MPVWMGLTAALHILLTVLTWDINHMAGRCICYNMLWIFIIVFSVLLPVPINNRVRLWRMIPSGRLDHSKKALGYLQLVRVLLITASFLLLILSYKYFV